MSTYVRNVMARRAAGEKGFTLIELLVVIVIIGILAAIAVPVFLSQRTNAYEASLQSDVTNAAKVMEGAYVEGTGYTDVSPSFLEGDGNTVAVCVVSSTAFALEGTSTNGVGPIWYNSATGGLTTVDPC